MVKLRSLVTGGTGAVGPELVQQLTAQGQDVRVLARHLPAIPLPKVDYVRGDICDAEALRLASVGVDTVYHLVAAIHNPNPSKPDEYHRVNVEGTRLLVNAAVTAGVRRFVCFSTISVYGHSGGQAEWLTEQSPLHPDTWYGETKAHAEQIVLAARGMESVVLRLAAVYGSRMKGNYASLVRMAQQGLFVPIGPGNNRRTLIATHDAAAGAILAATHPQAVGQIYNLTDGNVHTFAEIVQAVYAAWGRSAPRWHIPLRPVRWAAGLSELAFALVGKRSPIHRGRVDKLIEDMAVDGTKIQRELGFVPQITDLNEGWRKALMC